MYRRENGQLGILVISLLKKKGLYLAFEDFSVSKFMQRGWLENVRNGEIRARRLANGWRDAVICS